MSATEPRLDISADEVTELVEKFGEFGPHPDGGMARLVYTQDWQDAVQELRHRFETEGFEHFLDAAGNVVGRLRGSEEGGVVATGSHLDTAIRGGKFDGTAGVLAGFLAVRALARKCGQPKKTIDVIAISDEENSRYKSDFWGSRAITGRIQLDELDALIDKDGISVREAMSACGLEPNAIGTARRTDLEAWVELHIEQGPSLEQSGLPLGVVTAINGVRHAEHTVLGEDNHAGGAPIAERKDAVQGAARMIQAVDRTMRELGDPYRATVGRVHAYPGAPNIISGEVVFTTDLRHHEQERFEALIERVDSELEEIAHNNGLRLETKIILYQEAIPMDGRLIDLADEAASQAGIPHVRMHSGGGHDAQLFAQDGVPSIMLFVPSVNGLSHSPDEFTESRDLATGTRVLAHLLHRLAY
jgi:allantoate deiminase